MPQMTWTSVLDVLLLAFLIYQFLAHIRGTRSSRILLGASLVTLVLAAASVLHLTTVNWLILTLLPYLAFVLVVVFNREIRDALAKIGRQLTLSRLSRTTAGPGAYDDVVLAASLFSQNHLGALIVIEREIGLRTYIESGVPLDAHLSYDLLATIFRPKAPLHDGAVIIQNDRVAAAACFLPLSMNPVLSTQQGTRHRAAIGITEETDAVAIVVSEETGSVSLAVSGTIERNLTADELRLRMSRLLHRYLPPVALPTSIEADTAIEDEQDTGAQRAETLGDQRDPNVRITHKGELRPPDVSAVAAAGRKAEAER